MSNTPGDFKPGDDPRRNKGGAFKPGYDPRRNNGGRPKIAKALEANNTDMHGVTAELVATALAELRNPTSPACWNYAHKWLTDYAAQLPKPKEHVQLDASLTEADRALLEAMRMTPHERRQVIEAQDATIVDDD